MQLPNPVSDDPGCRRKVPHWKYQSYDLCSGEFQQINRRLGKHLIVSYERHTNIFCTAFQILRNHVMVRVGGGWDTLEHYLDKHDPCRCSSGKILRQIRFFFSLFNKIKQTL